MKPKAQIDENIRPKPLQDIQAKSIQKHHKTSPVNPVKSHISRKDAWENQTVKLPNNTVSIIDSENYLSFDKVTQAGWINEPLVLGLLTKKVEEENRFLFEFELNSLKFDAWSSKKNKANSNVSKLKEGYSYVVKGRLLVEEENLKYKIMLSKIEIISEREKNDAQLTKIQEMNQLIRAETPFYKFAVNVEILSGEVRRYMGCEHKRCTTGISKPDSNGKFTCRSCITKHGDHSERSRRVYLRIWKLELKDKDGNILKNGVCFHHQCEQMFGKEITKRLCDASSDLDARNEFLNFMGKKVNVAIKGQLPKTSGQTYFSKYQIIVKRVEVVTKTDIMSNSISETQPKKRKYSCLCENDGNEDEDDDEDDQHFMDIDPPENEILQNIDTPLVKVNTNLHKLDGVLDPKECYVLKPNKENWIGLAIIINIYTNRSGSKNDVKKLETLLPKLGIRIYKEETQKNLSKEEFKNALEGFKNELITKDYSSSFFIIMSHGQLYRHRLHDNTYINVYSDIMSSFGESEFPQFCGKPKIFIYTSCQNFPIPNEENKAALKDYAIGMHFDNTQQYKDTLECYPCFPGVKAKRDPKTGSYFIQNLVDVFNKYWKNKDIEKMLSLLQMRMSDKLLDNDTCYNQPIYKPQCFKQFYFGVSANSNNMICSD